MTDDGVKRNVPALVNYFVFCKILFKYYDDIYWFTLKDKHWAPRSIFSNYTGLVVAGGHFKTGAALEEWQHEAENFKKDLEFLLNLEHYEYVCIYFFKGIVVLTNKFHIF